MVATHLPVNLHPLNPSFTHRLVLIGKTAPGHDMLAARLTHTVVQTDVHSLLDLRAVHSGPWNRD